MISPKVNFNEIFFCEDLNLSFKKFLVYETKGDKDDKEKNRVECDFNNYPNEGKVCRVSVSSKFGKCTKDNKYGYPQSSPCVFLKLNKVRAIRMWL